MRRSHCQQYLQRDLPREASSIVEATTFNDALCRGRILDRLEILRFGDDPNYLVFSLRFEADEKGEIFIHTTAHVDGFLLV